MYTQNKITTLATVALLTLTACSADVQTSSGKDYTNKVSSGNSNIVKAGNVNPLLKFPAKFCMVKMSEGYMSRMTGAEVATWEAIATRHQDWGTIASVSPLVVNVVLSEGIGGSRNGKATTEHVRIAAARQHCDAILAFETVHFSGSYTASAVLFDARNGYTYITASQSNISQSQAFGNLSLEVEQAMSQLAVQLR